MRNVPQLRPFYKSDLTFICHKKEELRAEEHLFENMLRAAYGNCHTFEIKNEPAAIIGASCLWEGVWQVWAVVSEIMRGHGLYFTRACKIIIDRTAITFNIRRYNAIVTSISPEYVRWLRLLGFKYEYTMFRAAPNGADILGYVKWMGE